MRRRLVVLIAFALCAGSFADAARGASVPGAQQGRKLYVAKCAKCHKLYDPASYDDETWGKWMLKMKKKAKLNDTQFQLVSQYVETLRKKEG